MQKIYLARPGAQKEGPFTLDQINRDLATKKIRDTDYWAWHEGMPTWTPLYSVPGVSAKAWVIAVPETSPKPVSANAAPLPQVKQSEAPLVTSRTDHSGVTIVRSDSLVAKDTNGITVFRRTEDKPAASTPGSRSVETDPKVVKADCPPPPVAQAKKADSDPEPVVEAAENIPTVHVSIGNAAEEKHEQPRSEPSQRPMTNAEATTLATPPHSAELLATPSMASGRPFSALKQVFLFTTGEGPKAFKSDLTNAMLAEAVGRNVHDIQDAVPVDVIGGTSAAVVEAIRSGSIPSSAWRALYRIKHALARQIQAGVYHLCVRTFLLESKDLVAVFLLYSKEAP